MNASTSSGVEEYNLVTLCLKCLTVYEAMVCSGVDGSQGLAFSVQTAVRVIPVAGILPQEGNHNQVLKVNQSLEGVGIGIVASNNIPVSAIGVQPFES